MGGLFQPEIHNFDETNSGVSGLFMITENAEKFEYFTKFFGIDLMHVTVNEKINE